MDNIGEHFYHEYKLSLKDQLGLIFAKPKQRGFIFFNDDVPLRGFAVCHKENGYEAEVWVDLTCRTAWALTWSEALESAKIEATKAYLNGEY